MNRFEFVQSIIPNNEPVQEKAVRWAPVNIALVKYWGKRDIELNLPMNSSLSMTLSKGTRTEISIHHGPDRIWLQGKELPNESPFFRRLSKYLDLFRKDARLGFQVKTENEVPTEAGLASSASGFAATVLCLNDLFGWNLSSKELSLLARIGSGSACRSIEQGFVLWHKGIREDGFDSFGEKLQMSWDEVSIGIMLLSSKEKAVGSKEGMIRTQESSSLYPLWPVCAERDITAILEAIQSKNFTSFGRIVESNALTMHATMLSAWPPLLYWNEDTVRTIHRVHHARKEGLEVYLTMDAGPNVKLIFLQKDQEKVLEAFPESIHSS